MTCCPIAVTKPTIDLLLYILATTAGLTIAALATLAYWRSSTGRRTISNVVATWGQRTESRVVWLLVGATLAFPMGVVVGLLMGHFWWPASL